ncbi:MAG: NAD-dependent epimerase/dehydratase family protein [Planctomycetota bacterium]
MVTGAFGYSGSYIARRLLDRGARVRTLTNSPQRRNPFDGRVEARRLDFDRPRRLVDSLRGGTALVNTYWVTRSPCSAPPGRRGSRGSSTSASRIRRRARRSSTSAGRRGSSGRSARPASPTPSCAPPCCSGARTSW